MSTNMGIRASVSDCIIVLILYFLLVAVGFGKYICLAENSMLCIFFFSSSNYFAFYMSLWILLYFDQKLWQVRQYLNKCDSE